METKVKKGFIIPIPMGIRKRTSIKEGDKLLIETINGKVILLEKPAEKDAFESCKGMWKGRKETKSSLKYTRKIRRESERSKR